MTKPHDPYTFDRLVNELGALSTGPYVQQDHAATMMIMRGIAEVIEGQPELALDVVERLEPQLLRPGAPLTKDFFQAVYYGALHGTKETLEAALDRFLELSWPALSVAEKREDVLLHMAMGDSGSCEISNLVLPCLRFVEKRLGHDSAQRLAHRLGRWILIKMMGLGHEYPPSDSREVMEGIVEFFNLDQPLRPSGDGVLTVPWEHTLGELLLTADEYGYADDEDQNLWLINTLVRAGLDINECARFVGEHGTGNDGGGHPDPDRFKDVMGWLLEAGATWKWVESCLSEQSRKIMSNHPKVRQERLTELAANKAPGVQARRNGTRL